MIIFNLINISTGGWIIGKDWFANNGYLRRLFTFWSWKFNKYWLSYLWVVRENIEIFILGVYHEPVKLIGAKLTEVLKNCFSLFKRPFHWKMRESKPVKLKNLECIVMWTFNQILSKNWAVYNVMLLIDRVITNFAWRQPLDTVVRADVLQNIRLRVRILIDSIGSG